MAVLYPATTDMHLAAPAEETAICTEELRYSQKLFLDGYQAVVLVYTIFTSTDLILSQNSLHTSSTIAVIHRKLCRYGELKLAAREKKFITHHYIGGVCLIPLVPSCPCLTEVAFYALLKLHTR